MSQKSKHISRICVKRLSHWKIYYAFSWKLLTSLNINRSFLSRISTLTRDIDIAIMSVRPCVSLSVRDVPVSDENGLTYRHSFFHHTVA